MTPSTISQMFFWILPAHSEPLPRHLPEMCLRNHAFPKLHMYLLSWICCFLSHHQYNTWREQQLLSLFFSFPFNHPVLHPNYILLILITSNAVASLPLVSTHAIHLSCPHANLMLFSSLQACNGSQVWRVVVVRGYPGKITKRRKEGMRKEGREGRRKQGMCRCAGGEEVLFHYKMS